MITIEIKEDTPEPVMNATAKFILTLRDIIHGEHNQPPLPMPGATATSIKRELPVTKAVEQFTAPTEEDEEEGTDDGQELDVRGFPWDERIHASTKTKLANGEWKKRRGVEDVLVRQVEAELKGQDEPDIPDVPPATEWPGAATTQEPSAPTPETPDVPTPPTPTPATGRSYTQLVQLVTDKVTQNPDVGSTIQETVLALGHDSVAALQTEEPEVIGEAYNAIEAL